MGKNYNNNNYADTNFLNHKKPNHLVYMDDIKLPKDIGNSDKDGENILSWHRDGIWQRKMCHAIYEKLKTNGGRNWTIKPKKNHNAQRKRNLQIVRNIGNWHYRTSGDERKKFKKYLGRTRKLLETKYREVR